MALFCRYVIVFQLLSAAGLLLAPPPSSAATTALLAPIYLDAATSLYTTKLAKPSPPGDSPLMLDLDNSNLWRDCVNPVPYSSPTFRPLLCNDTAACKSAQSCTSNICGDAGCYTDTCTNSGFDYPACSNYTCASWASITAIRWTLGTSVWRDSVSLPSTDGRNVLGVVTMSDFAFLCADDTLLKGGEGKLPAGVVGGTGLSRNPIALPSQISAKIPTISRKFAYCLPAASSPGVLFFGDGPYVFLPGIDVSTLLRFTPILSFSKQADSYFIQIQSISVNNVSLPINASLLTIRRNSTSRTYVGGTRFTSSIPYTQLHPSIYTALASEFKKAAIARGIKPVAAVSPFDLCFDSSTALSTRLGYNVPEIDIFLKGKGSSKPVVWQIFGANSVVMVNSRVFCLAFQKITDEYEGRSILIGTYQQQNAFFQFDLAANRLGFLPTLLGLQTTCSNFNFPH